jgi:hypothetical protein
MGKWRFEDEVATVLNLRQRIEAGQVHLARSFLENFWPSRKVQ